MKITILNNIIFNESHIQTLSKLGELVIYKDTDTEEKAISRIKDSDIVIANCYVTPFSRRVFNSSKTLKLLAISSSGYETIDIVAAKEMGVQIVNTAGSFSQAVAEHVFGLILAVNKKIPLRDKEMRHYPHKIRLSNLEDSHHVSYNLSGKTLGIIGLGEIGVRVAKIGQGFGMNILAYNRSKKDIANVRQVSMNELLTESDVISIHLPSTIETDCLINKYSFQLMKSNAIIINTSRAKIIDEVSLYNALKSKKIMGAGLDVVTKGEVLNQLFDLDNVVFSPHVAFFTSDSIINCSDIIVENVEAFISGKGKNFIKE